MSVAGDILQSWRAPRAVIRRKLAQGPREDRALGTLMLACLLAFVAQWPGLVRAAAADPSIPLEARLGGALMGTMFLVPLIAYGLAAASRLALRAFGVDIGWHAARLALFWALLAVAPLMLAQGLVVAALGPGPVATAAGMAVAAAFLALWGASLSAAALEPPASKA
jgi:hypothetical protein